jgi:hypothetical protein
MLPPLDPLVEQMLRLLQRAVVKHPIATQAAYSALIREGRAFGETEEGRALREQLQRSELVDRLRTVWDVVTFGMLAEVPGQVIPSVLIEAVARAAVASCFESRVFQALLRLTAEPNGERTDDRAP